MVTQAKIGSWNNGGYLFNGLIDEVQIFNGALSAAQVQSIYQAGAAGVCTVETPTTTTVSSSSNPIDVGASLSLTATVTPSTATGTMTFMDGATTVGTSPVSSGQATLSTSTLAFGSHSITAVYSGDTSYSGSSSAPFVQVIGISGLACAPVPADGIAWWTFDETGGGTSADWFGLDPGTWVNSPVPAPGEVLESLRLNGSNYLTVPNSPLWNFGANDFTAELWANWDTQPGGSIGNPASVFVADDDGGGGQNKWIFALGGGVLELIVYNTAQPPPNYFLVQAPFAPVVGQWYHLAVTKTGTLYTIYVNGNAVGSEVSTAPIGAATAPLTIGQAEGLGYMQGRLDELTIYNRSLSPGEIQLIYGAGNFGKCKN